MIVPEGLFLACKGPGVSLSACLCSASVIIPLGHPFSAFERSSFCLPLQAAEESYSGARLYNCLEGETCGAKRFQQGVTARGGR